MSYGDDVIAAARRFRLAAAERDRCADAVLVAEDEAEATVGRAKWAAKVAEAEAANARRDLLVAAKQVEPAETG